MSCRSGGMCAQVGEWRLVREASAEIAWWWSAPGGCSFGKRIDVSAHIMKLTPFFARVSKDPYFNRLEVSHSDEGEVMTRSERMDAMWVLWKCSV